MESAEGVSPTIGELPAGPHNNDDRPNESTEERPEELSDPVSQDVAPLSHAADFDETLPALSITALSVRTARRFPNTYR